MFNNACPLWGTTHSGFPLYLLSIAWPTPQVQNEGFLARGFENKETYLQSDGPAAGFGKGQAGHRHFQLQLLATARQGNTYIFRRCGPWSRTVRSSTAMRRLNSDVLPDNAYFLASWAARELAGLYREQTRYSTDDRATNLAFAYQLQAMAQSFPLDIPSILQLAFQSTRSGQVQKYFQYTAPLASRLRVSTGVTTWTARNPGKFQGTIALLPTEVPTVINNAFVLIEHFPQEETSEDVLFNRAVAMAKVLDAGGGRTPDQVAGQLQADIGRGQADGGRRRLPLLPVEERAVRVPRQSDSWPPADPVHGGPLPEPQLRPPAAAEVTCQRPATAQRSPPGNLFRWAFSVQGGSGRGRAP